MRGCGDADEADDDVDADKDEEEGAAEDYAKCEYEDGFYGEEE